MVALARGCQKLQRLYLQENKQVGPTPLVIYSALCFFPLLCLRVSAHPKVSVCLCVEISGIFKGAFISYRPSIGALSSVTLPSLEGYMNIGRVVWHCLLPFFRIFWIHGRFQLNTPSSCTLWIGCFRELVNLLLFHTLLLWQTCVCSCHKCIKLHHTRAML